MAGLRDNFGIAVESPELGRYVDEAAAQGMGSLRRGWEAGRIGNEANSLSAEELNLRAAGDVVKANALREQIGALQQRQSMYSPSVNRVEDIKGVGDGLSWAAGQVGQGAASMIDPIAASAAISTAGRFLPGVAGKVAQGAALAVPYFMNQRQLTGEFGNSAYQDPELIARTSPTSLRDSANVYGAGAAVLDTALPGIIGRQLSGASRAGSAAARASTMGPGLKTLGGMAVEGATETAQSMGSQYTQGLLNPNRDTSGDYSENLNSFLGGAVGAGPFTAAGAYAEAGHNRIGGGIDRVKDAAGSVVDLLGENKTVQAGVDKTTDMAGKVRDGIIDFGENGLDKAKDAVKNFRQSRVDLSVLQGNDMPPAGLDEAGMASWFDKYDSKREAVIGTKLTQAAESGDAEAQGHLEKITAAPDVAAKLTALEEGAGYLVKRHDETGKAKLGNWGEAAGTAASMAGSAAASVGKGVMGLAKSFAGGVKEGFGKKNKQIIQSDNTGSQTQADAYSAWRDRMGFTQQNDSAGDALKGAPTAAQEASRRRAVLFGNKIAAAAKKNGNEDVAPAMRDIGHRISDWAAMDVAARDLDAPGMKLAMTETVHHMVNTLGMDAGPILGEMERVSGPEHAPLFEALKKEMVISRTPEGREMRRQLREDATNRLLELLPQKEFDVYSQDPAEQEKLLDNMERLAAGGFPRQVRDQVEQILGKPRLLNMLSVVNGVAVDTKPETVIQENVSDFDQAEALKKMEKSSGESIYGFNGKLGLRSKSGYKDIFATTKQMTKDEKAAAELAGEESVNRPQLFKTVTGADGKVQGTESLPSGDNTLEVNMQTVRDAVGYKDDENTNGYDVSTISAHDLMNDHGVQPTKRLALFRDYLRMDSQRSKDDGEKTTLSRKSTEIGRLLGRLVGRKERDGGPESWNTGEFNDWKDQLTAAQKAGYKGDENPEGFAELDAFDQARALKEAEKYFKSHHVVVASSTTDNDEQKMSVSKALDLKKNGKAAEEIVRRDAAAAGKGDMAPDEASAAFNAIRSMSNILYFTGKDGKEVPIKASDLVYWARSVKDKRGQTKSEADESQSPAKVNARYLEDMLDGIGAYTAEHSTTMPYKFNGKGEKEFFTAGGEFPKSLVLVHSQYGDAVKEKGFRLTNRSPLSLAAQEAEDYINPTNDARMSADNQAAVKADQEKNDDFFTPDDREERDLVESPFAMKKRRSGKNDESVAASASDTGGDLVTRGPNNRDINNPSSRGTSTMIRVDTSGTLAPEPKTDSMDATELDFTRGQDPKAEADENTALEYFTEHATKVSAKYKSPPSVMKAMSSARRVADGIMATMFADSRAGDRDVVTMLRTALRPVGAPKYMNFDAYRIAPLVRLVSTDKEEVSKDNFRKLTHEEYFLNSGATPALVNIVRRGAAEVLLRDDTQLTNAHRLKLTRELLGRPVPPKDIVRALETFLAQNGGEVTDQDMAVNWGDPSQMPVAPKMKAPPAIKPTLKEKAAAKADDMSWLPSDDQVADMINGSAPTAKEKMMAALESLQAKEKVSDADRKAEADRKARNAANAGNDEMVRKAKARLAEQRKAATGGAAAPLGKPLGGAKRKLNAMAVKLHQELGRDGFAATHDSPKTHEGRFDWRKFLGMGEGNSSFGVGTYLSTADGVHRRYKSQFTAVVREEAETDYTVSIDGMDVTVGKDEDGNPDFTDLGLNSFQEDVLTYMIIDSLSASEAWQNAKFDAKANLDKYADLTLENEMSEEAASLIRSRRLIPKDVALAEKHLTLSRWNRKLEQYGLALDAAARMDLDSIKIIRPPMPTSPTYEVSVDIKESQLLDWNAPLNKQPQLAKVLEHLYGTEEFQKIVKDLRIQQGMGAAGYQYIGNKWTFKGNEVWVKEGPGWSGITGQAGPAPEVQHFVGSSPADALNKAITSTLTGEDLYKALQREFDPRPANKRAATLAMAKVSEFLQAEGILGHRYAADGGKNDVHPNYVIYDDSKITTNYVHFNKQTPDGKPSFATAGEMAAAREWLEKVAPGTILNFIEEAGYSGEFIEAKNTIEVSTTAAAGILGTTYHEGLHKFFAQFVRSNPKLQTKFEGLVNDPRVLKRIHDLLAGYPEAQAQLTDGEERLAYAFQFWKAGLLKIDNEHRGLLQNIAAFFRRVLGMVRDSEHALAVFQAFDEGRLADPSTAGKVIADQLSKGTNALVVRRKLDGFVQGLAAATLPAEMILGNNEHSATARKLSKLLFTNPGDEEAGGLPPGYLNAKRTMAKQYSNRTNQLFENMDPLDVKAVQEYMQAGADPKDIKIEAHRKAVTELRTIFDDFHTYMRQAGLDVGKIPDYYPVVWSTDALINKRDKFIDLLVNKYAQQMNPDGGNAIESAKRIHAALVDRYGVDNRALAQEREIDEKGPKREDGVLAPFFAGQESRSLFWLDPADRAEFLNKDMVHTMSSYFHQGVRAAEYRRRFGENGVELERALKQIRREITKASHDMVRKEEIKDEAGREKWVARQMRDISTSVGAVEGTLGKDITPNMRKFNSYMIAYQNVRLLPYMVFSSFVDPLAQVARGAPMSAAWEIFSTNIKETFKVWGDLFRDMPPERQKSEWAKLAEHIGAVEVAMFNHHAAEQYSSTYMNPGAKKINDTLFKLNGMEAWDRSNRIMATKWAVRFLETHKSLPDKVHSKRWLAELGLTPNDVPTNSDGGLITTADEYAAVNNVDIAVAKAKMFPIHNALNRWVEGAVITPNAAQRPGWSSDPNYAAVFHLKQFAYSFQQTVMKRAVNELGHGNLAPIGALASFIPTMLFADLTKGLIQGGGSLPPYMASKDAGELLLQALGRTGLAGVGDIGLDALQDPSSLGGPAVEQVVDGMRDDIGRTALKAMPLNSMYQYMYMGGNVPAPTV